MAALGSTALVRLVAAFSFAELASVGAAKRWANHTIQGIAMLHDVQTILLDAESGQRGYLITADATYLESYREGQPRVQAQLRRLRELTLDNRDQQVRIGLLEREVDERFAALADSLRSYRKDDLASAKIGVRSSAGQQSMEHARGVLGELLGTEDRLLREREVAHERGVQSTAAILGGGSLAAFLLGIATNLGIRRGIAEKKRSQAVIEEQAVRLEVQTSVLQDSADRGSRRGTTSASFAFFTRWLRVTESRAPASAWRSSRSSSGTAAVASG